MCDAGEVVAQEGRLDQSGDTYLPTTVRRCGLCGYAEWKPALGVRWRAGAAVAAQPTRRPFVLAA
jgi:hypothetical protein